jgi:predicted metalloprotease with PDZ domain
LILANFLTVVFKREGPYPVVKIEVPMKVHYIVSIEQPEQHHVKVTLKLERPGKQEKIRFFMPAWSPGSYLIREYARHIRWFEASQKNGEVLFHQQVTKDIWEIDFSRSEIKVPEKEFQISYDVYCKDLTVRTSHIDSSHAWLHGPSYLMGVEGEPLVNPTIEFRFPALWSKLSTSLKDISTRRDVFLYQAPDYDRLIDCPVEIGCHETDGFMLLDKPHHIANYGELYPHKNKLKDDIKTIAATVAQHFNNELPYEQYLFINHFVPKLYGGLEHLDSTALQFDGRKLSNRKDYLNYLSLVAHEYFHLWNVKRIRPKELGPFLYTQENYTTLLWLAEGLTSFMDDLFVYRAGISTLEEYLEVVKSNLETYLSIPGRRFHSLEQSSFNAWIKLYRPDENARNSSVSYYLKGGLVFTVLHSLLKEKGSSVDELLKLLWEDYKNRPDRGITREEVYGLIKELGGESVMEQFSTMVETTVDIDFDTAFKKMGLELKWNEPTTPWLGVDWEFSGERLLVKTVTLDSPAHKGGLNAQDEILFLNGLRVLREDADKLGSMMMIDQSYELIVSRLGKLTRVEVIPSKPPRQLKEITIIDRTLAERCFKVAAAPAPQPSRS